MTHDPGGKVRLALPPITRAHALELFDYESDTGLLRWRTTGRGRRLDRIAGTPRADGYLQVNIGGRKVLVHRLILLMLTGQWSEQVDHRDGDKANNRAGNLRAANNSQNNANRRCRAGSKSGVKGVRFDARRGHWVAEVTKDRVRRYLGSFPSAGAASAAYRKASREVHGDFARSE